MSTGFLPIDPSLPSCQRGDDMGRKAGMTWLLVFADGWHVCYTESRRDDPTTPRYAVSGFYNMKEGSPGLQEIPDQVRNDD